jgi:predicted AAA+ superfamily ATPase
MYAKLDWKVHFYRDDLQREVDLIIDRGKDILAVEVKYSKRVGESDLVGLKAFSSVSPKKTRPLIVYRGAERQVRDGIEIIPYQTFLKEL